MLDPYNSPLRLGSNRCRTGRAVLSRGLGSFAVALCLLLLAPAGALAATLITSFSAGVLVDENVAKPELADYATQAGSHPEVAFTKFTLNTALGSAEEVRVDLPPGLSVNPQATPRCSAAGTTLSSCPASSRVGTSTVTIANIPIFGKQTVSGAVYNMAPPGGAPADFAFEVTVAGLVTVRTDLVGGLRWHPSNGRPGDYGEYFTISKISNALGTALEKSELVFWGNPAKHNGGGGSETAFLSNPTTCLGPQTTYIRASTYAPVASEGTSDTTPVGASGCASVPFNPTLSVTPSTTQHDAPDGLTVDLHVPQDQTPSHIATAHLAQADLTLPTGLALNPAAANGLLACPDASFPGEGEVKCPLASEAGSVEITTPVLGSPLTGTLYVAQPHEGNPYRVFLLAEDKAEGVSVRLTGSVAADPSSGRLTATFAGNPQLPFTDLKLKFRTGAAALFANPLSCGTATTTSSLSPYSGNAPAAPTSAFTVDVNGSGGACPGTAPFGPTASATPSSTIAAAATNLTLALARSDGEQTLATVLAKLPEGMLANLSATTLCGEPAAAQGTCSAASEIGTTTVNAGAGPSPLSLPGKVFFTGPYNGAPFGLSIVVPAIAGPYNLGTVVVRAAVALDTVRGQVTITSDPLPTILQGIPLRLRSVTVAVTRPEFLLGPASCTPTAITGAITSTAAQSQPFSSPMLEAGCEALTFAPTFLVTPTTTQRDAPTGLALELKLPKGSADLRSATVKLPPGLTLNPSVANGLQACSDAQLAIGAGNPVACPAASAIGTVEIHTPLLPSPLTGSVYVGAPLSSSPESGGEYRLFIDAESATYGISVRLVGSVIANASTGELTATFAETPPIPFSELKLALAGGPHAALAEPPTCGAALTSATLLPSTGAAAKPSHAYTVDQDGAGGACPATQTFSLTQATQDQPGSGGSGASFALELQRGEDQQYLSTVSTRVPPGLLGRIAAVTPCADAFANAGACPDSSRIGSVAVAVGSGSSPFELTGPVFLTGPYRGAPYGLAVEVPAESVGPFNFGVILTRASIAVDENSARVTVTSDPLPSIVGGAPLRLRRLVVTIGRERFLINPTSCSPSATESTLTSTLGATQAIATPFALAGCGALAFAPSVSASTSGQPSRSQGASLTVQLSYPNEGQANIAAVATSLPLQLPSRLTTLQKACPEASFAANPNSCPSASRVGTATVSTPVLPDPLSGPAYLVSNGGAAFPDLDIALAGDNLRLLLHGRTHITAGITSASFATVPDVPFTRFTLTLPQGPYSLLGANGSLCGESLVMPTTLAAQNGRQITRQVPIAVTGCPLGEGGTSSGGLSRLRIAPARFAAARAGASLASIPRPRRGRRARGRLKSTGATVSYRLAVPASVSFLVSRPTRGERRGRRCVARAARHRARRGRSCTINVRVGSFTHRDPAGAVNLHFTGRVAARALPPGSYLVQAIATTGAGLRGSALSVRFSIKRG